jgi:hypothetical protein
MAGQARSGNFQNAFAIRQGICLSQWVLKRKMFRAGVALNLQGKTQRMSLHAFFCLERKCLDLSTPFKK